MAFRKFQIKSRRNQIENRCKCLGSQQTQTKRVAINRRKEVIRMIQKHYLQTRCSSASATLIKVTIKNQIDPANYLYKLNKANFKKNQLKNH